MQVGDNVFYILRKGTGFPRETYFPAKIDSYNEKTKMFVILLSKGSKEVKKSAIPERNLSYKNHRGEINNGK